MPIGASRLNTLSASAAADPSLALTYVTSVGSGNNSSTVTTPSFSANIGDVIVYTVLANNTSGAPAALVIPAGFTVWYNQPTAAQAASQRVAMFYQISTTTGSRTLSSFTGTANSHHRVFVYRPSATATKITFTPGFIQMTIIAPINQTLTFGTMTPASVAFAFGGASSGQTAGNIPNILSSTVAFTRSLTTDITLAYYSRMGTFEGSGFSGTSTISKTDQGTNTMFSTVMTVTDQVARTTTATWAMAAGTMAYSTNTQKFGSANANFSGTSRWGRLTVNPLDSTFYFNSDQTWTVEFWQRNGNTFLNSGQGQIFCIGDDIQAGAGQAAGGAMSIAEGPSFGSVKNAYIGSTSFQVSSNGSPDIVVHKHYAFVCYGNGTASLFIDGSIRLNRVDFSSTLNSRLISMGQASTSNTQGTSWIFDEMRVSNVARYNDSFSVATAAYANDANTLALMHFDSNTTDSTT